MSELRGRRMPDGTDPSETEPGDYWKPVGRPAGEWWLRDPFGRIGRISKHTITEHEDGTITVEPSIAVQGGTSADFHGYLRAGVWTW